MSKPTRRAWSVDPARIDARDATHVRCRPHAALLAVLLALGCGGAGSSGGAGDKPAQPAAEPTFAATPAAVPADQPGAAEGMAAHLNLLNLAHLADVDLGGLFIDFGTPARLKYTIGHWRTGFGKEGVDGETTFTHASATSRVYLPLAAGQPHTLRMRVKPLGTQNLQLFVNGKSLPVVKLGATGTWSTQDVPLPADVAQPGENQILMRFGGTTKVDGEDVAVALDYVRILRGATPPAADPSAAEALPYYGKLVQDVALSGQKRKALVLPAPATLSYYVELPEKASLSLRAGMASGSGRIKVSVTPNGGDAAQVLDEAVASSWTEKVVSLGAHAGKIVRLDLIAEGQGSVAWASPAIVLPKVEVKTAAPAKSAIVLLIDTLRADALRAYDKRSRVETPALDAIAKEGVVFTSSQSPENWTKPSVASVLTGLFPATHRTKQSESRLPDGVLTIGEVLKQHGVATGSFIANGYVSDKFGFKQGWDHYTNYIRENKTTTAANVFKEAGDWIEKNKDARFFAYVHTIDPHVPYDPPQKWLEKYDAVPYTGQVSPRKTPDQLEKAKRNPPAVTFNERDKERLRALYDAEISYHDEELAKFIERLKQLGVYDDVVFVVTADHGEEFDDHGSWGHGHSVYQELLHVPLIFRRPGVLPAGTRIDDAVSTTDVTPTVLSAMGIAVPEVMEGTDRNAHMLGQVPAAPAIAVSDFLDDRRTIVAGGFKLILNGVNPTFFDLSTDPGEKRELPQGAHPIARRYCRILLGQFLGAKDLGDYLSPEQSKRAASFGDEKTDIDEKTRKELKALGYAN
jgi:choline-sulfatase